MIERDQTVACKTTAQSFHQGQPFGWRNHDLVGPEAIKKTGKHDLLAVIGLKINHTKRKKGFYPCYLCYPWLIFLFYNTFPL